MHIKHVSDMTEVDLIIERERGLMIQLEEDENHLVKTCSCGAQTFMEICPEGCVNESGEPLKITGDKIIDQALRAQERGEFIDFDAMFPNKPRFNSNAGWIAEKPEPVTPDTPYLLRKSQIKSVD